MKNIFLTIILLSFLCSVYAQDKEKIDSLLVVLENPKLDTATVYAYCYLSSELVGLNNRQANLYAKKGLDISEKIKNPSMMAWANHVLAESYDYLGVADSALLFYQKSIEIKRTLKDFDGEGSSNIGIGVLYFYQKDFNNAEIYFNKALELYTKVKNEKRIAAALNNLGAIYRNQNKYDIAIETYNKALELKRKTNDTIGISNALVNLGIVYQYKKQYDKAEAFYLDGIKLQQQSNVRTNQIYMYGNLASLKLEQGKYNDSKLYLDKALQLEDQLDLPNEIAQIYEVYTVLDTLTGDYKAAYRHLRLQNEYEQKVITVDRQKEIDKMELIFQTKEKENEILVNQKIIKNRNKTIWIISGILGVMFLLLLLLFKLRNKLHKSNIQLNSLVKEKENLVKEIHHRVKNNLQVISSLLNMHVRKVQDPQSKKIFDDGISRIQAMSIIHQNIYGDANIQKQKPKEYIEKLIQQLYITYQIPDKSIQINAIIEDIDLDIEKLMSIGLILNEILSNAFKYAFNTSSSGSIEIFLHKIKENEVEFIVKDSGKGISIEMIDTENNSLGMKLIKAFSEKLNATLSIGNVNGTIYKLIFDPQR